MANIKIVDQPIFAFDLHGVIVKKRYRGFLKYILRYCYRMDILLLFFNIHFLTLLTQLLQKSRIPEEYITTCARYFPSLHFLIQPIISMTNEQIPLIETVTIIKALKNKGYKIFLFSNIGERTYVDFEKKFPEIVTLFDDICIAHAHDGWIQKPQQAAFEKFLIKFSLNPEQCIFIDNSKKNIKTAQQKKFKTIKFKYPKTLKKELHKLGILL